MYSGNWSGVGIRVLDRDGNEINEIRERGLVPRTGFNGKEFLVALTEAGDAEDIMYGVRVSTEGNETGKVKVLSGDMEYPDEVTSIREKFLIIYSGNKGAIIDKGEVRDTFKIDTIGGMGRVKSCKTNNEEVFLVFTGFAGNPYCNSRVWGKFIRDIGDDNLPLTQLGIYPNINNGKFQIRFTGWGEGKTDIKMYDIMGREIRDFRNVDIVNGINKIDIDVRDIQSGKYFIYVSNGKNRCSTPVVILR